ncbi:MAG: sodium ion-translocating decarboxylase subunit beta [Oscillospiraceae bacterium]
MTEKEYIKSILKNVYLRRDIKKRVAADLENDIFSRRTAGEDMNTIIQDMGAPISVAQSLNDEMSEFAVPKRSLTQILLLFIIIAASATLVWGVGTAMEFIANIPFIPNKAASIGVIGGADGPTSIFVASNIMPSFIVIISTAIPIIIGSFTAYMLMKWQKLGSRRLFRNLAIFSGILPIIVISQILISLISAALSGFAVPIDASMLMFNIISPLVKVILPTITAIISLRMYLKKRKSEKL